MQEFEISLIISTYNWPEALELCLNSVLAQSKLPDEVLIADDGSTDETRTLINSFKERASFSVKHIWQEDLGFRKTAILNKALREVADHRYVILIDGDVILHKHFIADHTRLAERGYYVFGRRAYLSERACQRIMKGSTPTSIHMFMPGLSHRLNVLYMPRLASLFESYKRNKVYGIGCNLAAWQSDIIKINGFNEKMEGWGLEDTEFILRLRNSGLVSKAAKFQALMYHLWHPIRPMSEKNKQYYDQLIKQTHNRCEFGLKHISND